MNNENMFGSCMAAIVHMRNIASVGAVIHGMDASLFDLVDTAMDSDIDRIVRKATKNKRS